MQYDIKRGDRLRVVNDRDESLSWDIKMWGRVDRKDADLLLKEVNGLYTMLTEKDTDDIWELFLTCREVLSYHDETYRDQTIKGCIEQIISYFPEEMVLDYLKTKCNIFIDRTLTEPSDDYQNDRTYDVDSYYDLLVLTVYSKILMPIIGQYAAFFKKEIGVDGKEMAVMECLMKTPLSLLPGTKKLLLYCESWAGSKEGKSASAMTVNMSSADIYFLYLAKIITNRLPQSYIQSEDTIIIRSVFSSITRCSNDIDMNAPKEKRSIDDDDSFDSSITDLWRISDDISMNIYVGQSVYCENLPRLVMDVFSDLDDDNVFDSNAIKNSVMEMVNDNIKTLNAQPMFELRWYHMIPIQALANNAIYIRAVGYMERAPLFNLLAVVAAYLDFVGMRGLSALMLTPNTKKSADDETPAIRVLNVDQSKIRELQSRYPYLYQVSGKNPGVTPAETILDEYAREINNYRWSTDTAIFSQLKADVSNLLTNHVKVFRHARS